MDCPYCRTENPDNSLHCSHCGKPFPGLDDAETFVGGPSAPKPSHSSQQPAAAAGVMTPPPQGSRGGSVGTAWPRYVGNVSQLEPGTEFGPRYRIESFIGEGGMGTVYKAYDRDLDRVVALKLLRAELTADPDATRRFKQELLLASKVSHKNILRIHDLGDAEGIKFISMAYVEGEDLNQVLKREGKLPLERAITYTRQLCGALAAAHAEGVVHRDLKPHNIMLDKSDTVYISDFGLAKSLDAGAMGMTRTGEYLGTPRYMAPEQVEVKPVDQRTDLYSLGLILYEMVTGDVPFSGQTTLQVMYQRVKSKPKNPRELNPDLPDYMVRIILRCLETKPERRYQSAEEILRDLDAQRAMSMTRSIQVTLPMPETPRARWVTGVAAVVVLALLSLAIPAVRQRIFGPATDNGSAAPAAVAQKQLAVLPFRVLGDESKLNYIAAGLVDGLSAKLFQLKTVRVASAAATEEAARKGALDKIAQALGVSLLVQGTVQSAGNQIRIIVNLEDVERGERVWNQEFSGVPEDLLTLEDQIYTRMVNALQVDVSNEEMARAATRPTGNLEAYDLYLRGRDAMRGQQDVKNIQAALDFYNQALQEDSNFALAYTGLADASLAMYREKKESIWTERAEHAADQARSLNENLPEVHFALGSVYGATGRTTESIVELNRALELAPTSDDGQRRLAAAQLAAGKVEEAILTYRKAIDVNPYYWVNHNSLGSAYLQLGDNELALEAFRKVTQLESDNPTGYENMGNAYLRMGRLNEAVASFQQALERQPHPTTYSNLGTAYFFLKRYDEAVAMFEKAVELNPNDEVQMGNLADAYRWAGQKEKAMATYDKAIRLAFKALQVNPRDPGTLGSLALYYSKKGDSSQATEFIRRALSIDSKKVGLLYIEATVHAQAGRAREALAALRSAFENGYPAEEAVNDPELATLHSLTDFQNLVREFSAKK